MGEWLKLAAYRERLMRHFDEFDADISVYVRGNGESAIYVFAAGLCQFYEGDSLSDCIDKANVCLDAWIEFAKR